MHAQSTSEVKPRPFAKNPVPASKFVGKPGELSDQEEDRLDRIIDDFIQLDLGRKSDPKIGLEFHRLGPEAIPALIRGLNKSASIDDRCPVANISRKLNTLLMTSRSEEVLDFARSTIGSGVRQSRHVGILDSMKVNIILRKRELAQVSSPPARPAATSTQPASVSPSPPSPGSTNSPGKP
jgi:hypothetical protein